MRQSDKDTETDSLCFPGPGILERAVQLVRFLRTNCAWDRKQTAESLIPHLLEEVHEVVDAIREGSDEDLEEELGDLLLNLAFQIVVAEESGSLDTRGLDPLTASYRIQERVAGVGFDWENYRGAQDKVAEELEEVRQAVETGDSAELQEELGDLLFAVVNLTRLVGSHPTTVLARANMKFRDRFERLEKLARENSIIIEESNLQELNSLWETIKNG